MVIKCEAILDGNGVYYSGQTISGHICLSVDERLLIKALSLKISGYAHTEWDARNDITAKLDFVSGREDYIATTVYLIGSEDSTSIIFPEGAYSYNFSCGIPEKSPSSYENLGGYIRYQIKVVLDYSDKSEEILSQTLHVTKTLDLRPKARELSFPVESEASEHKYFFQCWKTPIYLYINISQGGYVPGETISVYARLLNEGSAPLRHLLISFNQVVTYVATSPRELSKTEKYSMVQAVSSLAGHEVLREFLEQIPIPNLPPTCDCDCKTIQLKYELEASIVGINENRGVTVHVPVLIGTIPIINECEINNGKPFEVRTPSVDVAMITVRPTQGEEPVPQTIIPSESSMEEAGFMTVADLNKDEKHRLNKEKQAFKPKYLYYEINEDVEMTPTTMEITKEITITSK